MNNILKIKIENKVLLNEIDTIRSNLVNLKSFNTVVYGPVSDIFTSHDHALVMTGKKLRRASTTKDQGIFLAKISKLLSSQLGRKLNIVEVGTAAGISGAYLLSGAAEAHGGYLYSFEGSPELADIANKNLTNLGFYEGKSFQIQVGVFAKTLPNFVRSFKGKLDLIFIDGNHRYESTLEYHKMFRALSGPTSIIVHDDISWSDEMKEAWSDILATEAPVKSAELYIASEPCKGIIFIESCKLKESINFKINLDNFFKRYFRILYRKLLKIQLL